MIKYHCMLHVEYMSVMMSMYAPLTLLIYGTAITRQPTAHMRLLSPDNKSYISIMFQCLVPKYGEH